jgi:hypothetical protein
MNMISKNLLAVAVMGTLLATGCGKMPGTSGSASATEESGSASKTAQLVSSKDSDEAAPFASRTSSKDANSKDASSKETREAPAKPAALKTTTLPAGTSITVRLQTSVSSATASVGDHFDAVLAAPLEVNGATLAPAGAPATGQVVAVNRSGRLGNPGMIALALTSVEIGGRAVAVDTSTVSAKGGSHKKRNLAMIAGGAGGGALLGGLLGGGKGALIGSAVGAGAGTGTAYATGKKDVGFGAERHLTFRLKESAHLK